MKPGKDIYFQKALEEGYLARSAYKLLQIDEVFNLFEGVTKAVDLCSAPGSWTQVIYNKLHRVLNNYDPSKLKPDIKIVSVDMMPMDHLPGVFYLQKDISQYSTMKLILEQFGNEQADVVVCDGAIDVIGMKMIDYYMHHRIFLSALYITLNVLKIGGNFIVKIFIGKGHEEFTKKLELCFRNVTIVIPNCSRNKEAFAVCQNYTPLPEFDPIQLTQFVEMKSKDFSKLKGIHRKLIPYLCGDCYRYEMEIQRREKIQSETIDKDFLHILNRILKDIARDDLEILKQRAEKNLVIYRITEDGCLEMDDEISKMYFQGLKLKAEGDQSTSEEINKVSLDEENNDESSQSPENYFDGSKDIETCAKDQEVSQKDREDCNRSDSEDMKLVQIRKLQEKPAQTSLENIDVLEAHLDQLKVLKIPALEGNSESPVKSSCLLKNEQKDVIISESCSEGLKSKIFMGDGSDGSLQKNYVKNQLVKTGHDTFREIDGGKAQNREMSNRDRNDAENDGSKNWNFPDCWMVNPQVTCIPENFKILGDATTSEMQVQNQRSLINATIGAKIKKLQLENRGKHCGLGFNLDDWTFFTEGSNENYLESSEDQQLLHKGFHQIYEEIDKSRDIKFRNLKEIVKKHEKIKDKARDFLSKIENQDRD